MVIQTTFLLIVVPFQRNGYTTKTPMNIQFYGLINERVNAGRTLTLTDAFPLTTTDASITTFQAPSIDRLHGILAFRSGTTIPK